jgi:hypothetical protein
MFTEESRADFPPLITLQAHYNVTITFRQYSIYYASVNAYRVFFNYILRVTNTTTLIE